jgi:hypothetical protein
MWKRNVESERERGAKAADIALRLETFAVAVLELMPKLERHWASRHVARQLGRCATGGGSNYEEARGAETRLWQFTAGFGVRGEQFRSVARLQVEIS